MHEEDLRFLEKNSLFLDAFSMVPHPFLIPFLAPLSPVRAECPKYIFLNTHIPGQRNRIAEQYFVKTSENGVLYGVFL